MKLFRIAGCVSQQRCDWEVTRCLFDSGTKKGCVVAGAARHYRGTDQMCGVMGHNGELGPLSIGVRSLAAALQEPRAGVAIFEARGVNRSAGRLVNQAIGSSGNKEFGQEGVKGLFFKRRFSAFSRVVK